LIYYSLNRLLEKNDESQNNSGKKRKIVYLPFLLPGKINKKEGVEEDQKEEKIESKEKHHKSKDKCAICIRRRAKREQERLQ